MADEEDDDVIDSPVGREVGPDEDDAPDAGQPSVTVGRRERKPLNKELFGKFKDAVKKHLADEDDELQVAETGPAATAAKDPPPAGDAKPDPAADPAKPERSGPPAEAIAAWERVNLRAADLDKREESLKERESRARDVAGRFADDPWGALTDLVKLDLGDDATEDEIAAELAYQVTALSMRLAGATVDTGNTAHDVKQLKRELRRRTAAERKAAAGSASKQAEADKKARTDAAIKQIGQEFQPLADKYRWLASAEAPADLLFDVIKRRHEQTGEILEIEDAARLADDYLKAADLSWYEKKKHLLQPTPAPTPAAASTPQGDPPPRRSRVLTNADASEDAPPPEKSAMDDLGQPPPVEERRRRSFERFKAKQQARAD